MVKGNWGEKRRGRLLDYVRGNYVIVYQTKQTCVNWALLTDSATRLGRVLSTANGWVAASATTLDIPIATNNARDLEYLPGIKPDV
jgi:predicted nucleic acid-binding protein